jgi:exopolysaccharide biosynthesis polyprenyl glycosylphosphotransferase
MIILGDLYQFNKLELANLTKFNITHISYKDESAEVIIDKIETLINSNHINLIVLNTKAQIDNKLIKYLTKLELKGISFVSIENFLEQYLHKLFIPNDNSNVDYLDKVKPFKKYQYIQKRVIDYIGAATLTILTSPIMIYAAYRIKKESPDGPIMFRQKRVGKDGKEFVCYKFRSMIPDAENGKPQFASKDDPRVFKWGAIMRKTRIDELPQLINVCKGQMHLVGPRPERLYWIEQFEKDIPYYNQRHLVAPGITGWAQVNYPYGANAEDARKKLMYDLYYIKHWSPWLEIRTIWKTVMVVLGKRGL